MKKKTLTIIMAIIIMLTGIITLTACSGRDSDLEFVLLPCETSYSVRARIIPPRWFGASPSRVRVARTVTIPNTHNGLPVTHIYGFNDQSRLRTITIPKSVIHIGDDAFAWSRNLRTINGMQGVLYIGARAFRNNSFSSFSLPPNLTSIGEQAFLQTNYWTPGTENFVLAAGGGLSEIFIPQTVSHIGDAAFAGNGNLSYIEVASNNQYFVSANGILFNIDKTRLIAFPTGRTETYYSIPGTVSQISAKAFFGSSLTSVTIPSGVMEIRNQAFNDTPLFRNSPADSFVYADRWVVGINNDLGTILSSTINFVFRDDTVGIATNSIVPNPLGHLTIPYSVRHISPAAFINVPQQLTSLAFERPASSGITQFGIYSFSDSLTAGTFKLIATSSIYVPCEDSKAEYSALINAIRERFSGFGWSHSPCVIRVRT